MKMRFPRQLVFIGASVVSALLSMPASAVGEPLPPLQYQGTVAYLTGGVGQSEAHAMQAAAPGYPLQMEFVEHEAGQNAFLAGVRVSIENSRGREVLGTTTEGPFLFVDLPAGRYTIVAENGEAIQERQVAVPGQGTRRVVFAW